MLLKGYNAVGDMPEINLDTLQTDKVQLWFHFKGFGTAKGYREEKNLLDENLPSSVKCKGFSKKTCDLCIAGPF